MFGKPERKERKMKSLILISVLFLTGCASVGTFTSPSGEVWTAKVTGNAAAEMKTKDLQMKIKREPLIKVPEFDDIEFNRD